MVNPSKLTLVIRATASVGDTVARLRFSSTGALNFDGPAADGEVEESKTLAR
jgi:hypothetical protein